MTSTDDKLGPAIFILCHREIFHIQFLDFCIFVFKHASGMPRLPKSLIQFISIQVLS